jgi:hypothetical protein
VEGLNQFFQTRAAEMWIGLALLVLILEVWIMILHRRIARLQSGKGMRPPGLVQLSGDERSALAQLQAALPPAQAGIAALQQVVPTAMQKFGMLRFNPFDDTGGDQSFALCVADATGNGFVMSCLHRRNESKLYAKPLAGWQSKYSLSDEERQAISIAQSSPQSDPQPA